MTVHSQSGQKQFRTRVFELISGSSLAQVFSFLLMPVITRIYSPAETGDYAVYVSTAGIIGLLAGLRLDWAVMIAANDEEASALVWLGLFFSVVTGTITFAALGFHFGYGVFAFFTALSVVCTGGVQALVTWCSRHQRYRVLAGRSAGEKFFVLVLAIGLGYFGWTKSGLIASQSLGLLFSVIFLIAAGHVRSPPAQTTSPWLRTLIKYREFPLKNLASTALLCASVNVPTLLFAAVFAKADVGQFNQASRVLEIPITFIGYAFSTVYYQHTSVSPTDQRLRMFHKSMRTLALIFVPPFAIAALTAPLFFPLVFGSQWGMAGSLAQWIAPLALIRLLYISQAPLLLVQRKLGLDLVISLFLFLGQACGFGVGWWFFHSLTACVIAMSTAGTAVYTAALFLIWQSLKRV